MDTAEAPSTGRLPLSMLEEEDYRDLHQQKHAQSTKNKFWWSSL
jgi:hypothetical protein